MALTPRSFSISDLELLGYSDPQEDKTERYAIFSGVAVAGLERLKASFLYLKSDFTNEDAAKAKLHFLRREGRKYVVVPQSEEKRRRLINELFGSQAAFFLYEDLIWKKVSETFSQYSGEIRTNTPPEKYYVPP